MNKNFLRILIAMVMALAIFTQCNKNKPGNSQEASPTNNQAQSSESQSAEAQNAVQVKTLTSSELHEKLKADSSLFVLDVRTNQEYSEGHIKGSMLLPVQVLGQQLDKISDKKDSEIYVICHSGARLAMASDLLASKGFTKLYNVTDGMSGWKANGFPVE